MNIKNKTPIYYINVTLFVLISIGVALAAIYIKPETVHSITENNGNEEALSESSKLHTEQVKTNDECSKDETDSCEINSTVYDIEPNNISIINEYEASGIKIERLSLNEISSNSMEKSEISNNEECDLESKIIDEQKTLTLSAIITGNSPMAMINNEIVKIGMEIQGFIIEDIQHDHVSLEKNGIHTHLKIKKVENLSFKNSKNNQDSLLNRIVRDEWTVAIENIKNAPDFKGELINSGIHKQFRGWFPKRIYELRNGQLWKQISDESKVYSFYMPRAAVYKVPKRYKMKVCWAKKTVDVERVNLIGKSSIECFYGGNHSDAIFKLKDGTVWKKKSEWISESKTGCLEILLYKEFSNDMYMMFRESDEILKVSPIHNYYEGRIVNYFKDIKDNIIIVLDNGQKWVQLDTGFTNYCLTYPNIIIYQGDDGNHMISFEDYDITIPVRKTFGIVKNLR